METGTSSSSSSESFFSWFLSELLSPVNAILTLICGYLAYRILRGNQEEDTGVSSAPVLPPPLPKHDMTLEELRIYDGTGTDGRVCIAVNRKVFDVTKGKSYYSKGGPYANFAGRDATRALGAFDIQAVKDTWDDYSDISASHMASAKEWEEQFSEKYDFVGYLVQEQPSDDKETTTVVGEKED